MKNLRTLIALCVLGLVGPHAAAQKTMGEPAKKANVFVHPDKLTAKDKLTDGPSGKAIEIKSETTLVWVDLLPDARFAHPTEYVLISVDGTRVVKGNWRPVLNGKDLFTQTKVTDAGLPELAGLKSLKHVSLVETRVTEAGVAQLQKRRPGLTVERESEPRLW